MRDPSNLRSLLARWRPGNSRKYPVFHHPLPLISELASERAGLSGCAKQSWCSRGCKLLVPRGMVALTTFSLWTSCSLEMLPMSNQFVVLLPRVCATPRASSNAGHGARKPRGLDATKRARLTVWRPWRRLQRHVQVIPESASPGNGSRVLLLTTGGMPDDATCPCRAAACQIGMLARELSSLLFCSSFLLRNMLDIIRRLLKRLVAIPRQHQTMTLSPSLAGYHPSQCRAAMGILTLDATSGAQNLY